MQKQTCSVRFQEEALQPVMGPGLCGVSDAACTNLSQRDLESRSRKKKRFTWDAALHLDLLSLGHVNTHDHQSTWGGEENDPGHADMLAGANHKSISK